jgi:hypothetical protein
LTSNLQLSPYLVPTATIVDGIEPVSNLELVLNTESIMSQAADSTKDIEKVATLSRDSAGAEEAEGVDHFLVSP